MLHLGVVEFAEMVHAKWCHSNQDVNEQEPKTTDPCQLVSQSDMML